MHLRVDTDCSLLVEHMGRFEGVRTMEDEVDDQFINPHGSYSSACQLLEVSCYY